MPRLVFESVIEAPPEALWNLHSSAEALHLLTPPGREVEVAGDDLRVVEGAIHVLQLRQYGIPIRWHARIECADPPHGFVDVALRSPFRRWRHAHRFLPHPRGSVLRDEVEYDLPLGPLGVLVDWVFVRRDVCRLFAYRHAATRAALER